MSRLTEEMVIARSKQSDLAAIKKLNCWGAELEDVSLLRQMPNVEVLALSLNKIDTLEDFAWCERLKELYVRKNDIRDLREIRHLRRLPALISLWLDENPCTDHPEYRMTVLRNLPNLERLDNLPVHPDEVSEAHRRGTHIADSDDEEQCQSNIESDQQEQEWRQPSPDIEPPTSAREEEPVERQEWADRSTERRENVTDRRESATDRRENATEYREPVEYRERVERREPEWTERRESRDGDYEYRETPDRREEWVERRDHHPADRRETERQPCRAATAMTRSYYAPPCASPAQAVLRHSASAHSVQQDGHGEGRDRLSETSRCGCACVRAEWRGRRPTARNSNLLSAVLCLVKELDYPSLEVVELAVRCRMDELASSQ